VEGSIHNSRSAILWTSSSPATFQTIINLILQNLINTGKVASFIDNVIVGAEEKKGYE